MKKNIILIGWKNIGKTSLIQKINKCFLYFSDIYFNLEIQKLSYICKFCLSLYINQNLFCDDNIIIDYSGEDLKDFFSDKYDKSLKKIILSSDRWVLLVDGKDFLINKNESEVIELIKNKYVRYYSLLLSWYAEKNNEKIPDISLGVTKSDLLKKNINIQMIKNILNKSFGEIYSEIGEIPMILFSKKNDSINFVILYTIYMEKLHEYEIKLKDSLCLQRDIEEKKKKFKSEINRLKNTGFLWFHDNSKIKQYDKKYKHCIDELIKFDSELTKLSNQKNQLDCIKQKLQSMKIKNESNILNGFENI